MKSYRYEATGLARVANSLADRAVRATRWRATAMFALFIFTLCLVIFCRVGALSGFAPAADRFTPAARSSEMIVRHAGIAAAVVLSSSVLSSSAAAQDAVQWRVEDGGNGHWYSTDGTFRNWSDARTIAVTRGAHLATIHSAAENQFVLNLALVNPTDYWLGAFRSDTTCQPPCFEWVTGELWSYEAPWNTNDSWGCANPNPNYCGWNGPGSGVALELSARPSFSPGSWNDEAPDLYPAGAAMVIEWSADCNNDGIVDYGQIRAGELVDVNANNIPDCCETSTSCDPCSADVVEDGVVNAVDLAAVINAWGTAGGKLPRSDVDGSGLVDGADLATVLSSWGPCQP